MSILFNGSEGEGEAVHQASAGNPKKATESKNRRKLDPPKRNRKEGHPDKMEGFCCKILLFLVQAKLSLFGPYVSHKS